MTEPEEPRHLYVVAGGTPAARAVIEALESPEAQAALRESFERMAQLVGETVAEVVRAFGAAAAAWLAAMPALREALSAELPLPEDPRGRALELRRRRSTGPDRQVQHRKRPRRIA
jgi:hypothetical protein